MKPIADQQPPMTLAFLDFYFLTFVSRERGRKITEPDWEERLAGS